MSASFLSAMNTRADDNVAVEKTGFTIWVSNSCGQLFIFNDVPKDADDGWDICDWWEANDIDHVVGNNKNSCDWGEFGGEITRIETPAGGWEAEESDEQKK